MILIARPWAAAQNSSTENFLGKAGKIRDLFAILNLLTPDMCDTWFLSAGSAAQAQLLQAKGCEGGEMGTYLGNLCFSFLRLCLVGGTDTRHWAISSYWALVNIMLGQRLGDGGDK